MSIEIILERIKFPYGTNTRKSNFPIPSTLAGLVKVGTSSIDWAQLIIFFIVIIIIISGVGCKYCGHFWPIVQAPGDR
jgi:hypothetical protein